MKPNQVEEYWPHIELHSMRNAHIPDGAAWTRGLNCLHHRFFCADALENRIHTNAVSQFLYARNAFLAAFVTISVAPNSLASCWRFSCRLIAIIRSAPSCLAERMPSSPTAPSPTTATVAPGSTLAASAADQPVQHIGNREQAGKNVPGAEPPASQPASHPPAEPAESVLAPYS